MENKYFTRKINEGTVKRTHVCSFDKDIKLDMVVTNGRLVMDSLVKSSVSASTDKNTSKLAEKAVKDEYARSVSALRINGLPIVYEELANCFDGEEIMEVMHFINGGDMSIFGGEPGEVKNV